MERTETEKAELETLIAIADEKINFVDTCEVEPFPADLGESVRAMIEALAEGRSVPETARKTINVSQDIAHRMINYLGDNSDPPSGMDLLIRKYFGINMYKFMIHDQAHLSDSLYKIRDAFPAVGESGNLRPEMVVDSEFYPRKLEDINTTAQKIALMYAHPWRLVKFLARKELSVQPEYEQVSLKDMFKDVAEVLSMRFHAEIGNVPNPATSLRRSIAILGEDLSIVADRGLIWSIVYNNLKNSQKKFDEEGDRYFLEHVHNHRVNLSPKLEEETYRQYLRSLDRERTSTVAGHTLNQDYIVLIFSDTGSPVDLNKMVHQIRGLMQRGKVRDSDWVNPGMGQRYTAWSENDFRFNRLTMEDITNTAFMARVGGSEIRNSISSGMGLYGTRQIIESLGGAILYTTTFKDENPRFVYILPKRPAQNRTEALDLREQMIESGLQQAA